MQRARHTSLATMLLCCLALAGCATGSQGGNTHAPPPAPAPKADVSGDWELQFAAKSNPLFTRAAGFFNQQPASSGGTQVTAALTGTAPGSGSCFAPEFNLSLLGSISGLEVGLQSFQVDGQTVSMAFSPDASGTSLSGTYQVTGGCAAGASGTVSGQKYQVLQGLYTGQVGGSAYPLNVALSLTEIDQGTGDGRFLVSGSATFSGQSCFTRGALNFPDGYVLGNQVTFALETDDPDGGVQVLLNGSIDPAAETITLSGGSVQNGLCAQNLLSGAVLKR